MTKLERLDYLYTPSRDVAADIRRYVDGLGGRLVFAIEAMGTRVAMIELTPDPPRIVLADHLAGDQPILVFRVADLEDARRRLVEGGWPEDHALEIPQGPVATFRVADDQRVAIYELTRPGVIESFEGRRDFG